jgi:DNA-binding NtrC family response regulator
MTQRRDLDDPCRLLLVDDEVNLRAVLKGLLERDGYSVDEAQDGAAGLVKAREKSYAAVLTDLRMPGMDGLELLAALREERPEVPVVMLTAHGTVATAVDAMKRGAFDFLTKPFDQAELAQVIERAVTSRLMRRRELHDARPGLQALVGAGPAMARVRERIAKVAAAPSNVLILGETGTGKELVARALHEGSPRAGGSFVATNCAAIPETMVEAELFGHERGAFTGAVATRPGRFELADGGTLFLDEVGDMDLKVQPKLLRALEQREVQRVGASATRKVDVRVVAATHADLAQKVERGLFRRDLWFRLAVLTIELPPLRERREDLPELVDHFRKKHGARLKKTIAPASRELLARLHHHDWPGNVRELENVVESLVVLCDGTMAVRDLPGALQQGEVPPLPPLPTETGVHATAQASTHAAGAAVAHAPGGPLKDVVRDAVALLERELITKALKETDGNVTHAATALGLSRKGLQLKLKELSISRLDVANG